MRSFDINVHSVIMFVLLSTFVLSNIFMYAVCGYIIFRFLS